MLPPANRLRRSDDFTTTVRQGRRAGRTTVVGHLVVRLDVESPPQIGFVVGRGVGNAVIRHRVSRRLRHVVRSRLNHLPAGAVLVVRALPPAAVASSAQLTSDVDSVLARLLRAEVSA